MGASRQNGVELVGVIVAGLAEHHHWRRARAARARAVVGKGLKHGPAALAGQLPIEQDDVDRIGGQPSQGGPGLARLDDLAPMGGEPGKPTGALGQVAHRDEYRARRTFRHFLRPDNHFP